MPKQFHELLGIPMLWWSVRAFHAEDPATRIVIVLHPGFFDDWDILYAGLPEADREIPVKVVCGGRNRTHSVANGLMSVDDDADTLVAVHDAARPMLTPELVSRMWDAAERSGAAVPVCPETNSLRRRTGGTTEPVDRSEYVIVQTPQAFRADILKSAYARFGEDSFSDDASMVQECGYPVEAVEGETRNIKVTNPEDFAIAGVLMKGDW